jgi:hypothetical protein
MDCLIHQLLVLMEQHFAPQLLVMISNNLFLNFQITNNFFLFPSFSHYNPKHLKKPQGHCQLSILMDNYQFFITKRLKKKKKEKKKAMVTAPKKKR